jgi:D-alanyl-D-alanine carboxypeptidase (penicillin-binding protein 5/6)
MPSKNRKKNKKPHVHWLVAAWWRIAVLVVIAGLVSLYPGQNVLVVSAAEAGSNRDGSPVAGIPVPPVHPYPVNTSGVMPGDDVTASSAIVLDADSMVYMYRRNDGMRLSPASTTKIMTALVSLDHYSLDDVVTIGNRFVDGQAMELKPGERITVENLLYGALILSGNDAAYALADHYPGGLEAFVAEMNRKAASLGLKDTHFTNPAGLDDPEHKMTARDLSLLSVAALGNKTVMKMVAIPQITISDVDHTTFHKLANVNQLLGKIPGVAGIKTGWTEEAGENLVTLVERGGRRVIFVVLHSKDRFGDTTKLIDWAFGNFRWIDISV